MKLVLGVVDMPYAQASATPPRRRSKGAKRPVGPAAATSTSTGDVAQILERRYGVMAMFALLHGADLGDAVAGAMQDKLERLLLTGEPPSSELFSEGDLSEIEETFRAFLDNKEMDGRAPGVPTEAAQRGVNHRMARPYVRRGPRPSFIDTGLYQDSMRAWVED